MAITLEELQIKFSAETGALKSQLQGVGQQINNLEQGSLKAQKGLGLIGKGAVVAGIAKAGQALVGIGKDAIAMANDVVESESLFDVSMGGMADKARAWSDKVSGELGLNPYEMRKNVGMLNTMFGSMGLGEQEAYDMATSMTELANDMASFYNLGTEEAFTKLRAGITGEAEPLKALGILIDEQTISQYAYKNGIAKTGAALTQQQKIQARYGAIMAQTSKAQGDLARTMDSPTNQLRRLNTEFDKAKIALGQALQPALIAVLPAVTGFASGLANMLSGTGLDNGNPMSGAIVSLADATAAISGQVDTSIQTVQSEINRLSQEVEAKVKAYNESAAATKSLILTLQMKPKTTGFDRILEIIGGVESTLRLHTADGIVASMTATVNALAEDGEITGKDIPTLKAALREKLGTFLQGQQLEDAINAIIAGATVGGEITDNADFRKTLTDRLTPFLKGKDLTGAVAAIIAASADAGGVIDPADFRGALTDKLTPFLKGKDLTDTVDAIINAVTASATGENAVIDPNDFQASLQSWVKAYVADKGFSEEVEALMVAALQDGEISKDEVAAVIKKLDEELAKAIKGLEEQKTAEHKIIARKLEIGEITQAEADEADRQIAAKYGSLIEDVTASFTLAKAEVRVGNWEAQSLSVEDKNALKASLQAEVDAAIAAMTAAEGVAVPLFAGTGLEEAVAGIFESAKQAAIAGGEALQKAIVDGTTPDWKTIEQIRTNMAIVTAATTGELSAGAQVQMALANLSADPKTLKNFVEGFDAVRANNTKAYKDQYDTQAGWWAEIAAGMPDLFAEELAKLNALPENIEKGLQFENLNDVLMHLAQIRDEGIKASDSEIIQGVAGALLTSSQQMNIGNTSQNDLMHQWSSLWTMLDSMNFDEMTAEGQSAYMEVAAEMSRLFYEAGKTKPPQTPEEKQSEQESGSDLTSMDRFQALLELVKNSMPETPPDATPSNQDGQGGEGSSSGGGGAPPWFAPGFTPVVDGAALTLNNPKITMSPVIGMGLPGFAQAGAAANVNVSVKPQPVYLNLDGYTVATAVAQYLPEVAQSSGG